MATVQISDVIDVTVFQDLPSVDSPEKTVFFDSGIVEKNALFDSLATAAGKSAELPFWNDIDPDVEPNRSNDDPTDIAVPAKIIQGEQISRKAFLNKGLSATDLAVELALGENAMTRIRNRVDTYWRRQWQRRLIASCNGILADNVSNNGSDMVYVAAGLTNADVTANTIFTRQNLVDAAYTLGDRVDGITLIGVHSMIHKRMVSNNEIEYLEDSEGRLTIPAYMGKRLVVDDSLPYTPAAGAGGADAAPRYTTVLFGPGIFGYGDGVPANPVAVERQEAQGQGGGVETLWTRKTWLLHPFGYQHIGTPANGETGFNLAELAGAGVWTRVIDRKLIPMAFLVTNG